MLMLLKLFVMGEKPHHSEKLYQWISYKILTFIESYMIQFLILNHLNIDNTAFQRKI